MTLRLCSRRSELLYLLASGAWPQACPPDLDSHLAECRACSELLLVTHTFRQARATTFAQATLPAPSAIWWRAQLRRRNAAVERVGKPIFGAYIFALAITIAFAVALAVVHAPQIFQWLTLPDWLGQSQSAALHMQTLSPSTLLSSGWRLALLIPILATIALLSGVAVYISTDRK